MNPATKYLAVDVVRPCDLDVEVVGLEVRFAVCI